MVQSGIPGGASNLEESYDSGIAHGGAYRVVDLGLLNLTDGAADKLLHVPNGMSPARRGRIVHTWCEVEVPTTDTNADGTLTVEINGSAITGGVVTIADISDGTPSKRVSDGNIVNGTAITAGNTFKGSDYIDIAYATSNAFADGVVRCFVLLEYGINS